MRLLKFEQVLDESSGGVEVTIEITLSALLTKVYEQRQISDSLQTHDMASAMQAALNDLFAAVQIDLASGRLQTR
jgi:ABC-type phosphonate transport system ATPase subunit